MAMTRTALIAAAAQLAGGVGIAAAQTSPSTTPSGAAAPGATRCWDPVTKQVRNETAPRPSTGSTGMSGSSTASGAAKGSATTGSTSSTAQTRPPQAMGLSDCRS